ncbi:MAG TPA: phosphohydrolase [Ruminococcaceae bacterium]|nr:phosphohydrolase [Oscillospiraceae bacterium]
MTNTDYKSIIRKMMGDYRYEHSVNVAKEAVELAKIYGADIEKAYTAGILHDITKEIPKDEQLKIISDGGIILDDVQKNAPKLWHSISGSVYIQTNLGINDSDIINAVRYHTTGRANMSLLEKIIYIADYTAKGREYNGVEIMREKSRKSLEEAMIFSFQYTFENLSSKEIAIHPDEVHAYNYIVLNKERTAG